MSERTLVENYGITIDCPEEGDMRLQLPNDAITELFTELCEKTVRLAMLECVYMEAVASEVDARNEFRTCAEELRVLWKRLEKGLDR